MCCPEGRFRKAASLNNSRSGFDGNQAAVELFHEALALAMLENKKSMVRTLMTLFREFKKIFVFNGRPPYSP